MAVRNENREMRILSAIGIILVVAGHLGYNLFEIGDLFPYYSFHVFIFVFISGYFYKPESKERMGAYIGRKCLSLLLPYFLWNFVYGIVVILMRSMGFYIGGDLSFRTLLIAPFVDGHQFMYNYPAWFVPALFLIEVVNVIMRKILSLLHLENEWLNFAGCLLAGILTVYLAKGGHVWGYYKIPGRILFMLPGFQLGRIYKEKIEKYDRQLSDGIYLVAVILIQVLVIIWSAGLAFSAVWVTSFANSPIVPYITVCTGIAFWLRVAKILSKIPYFANKLIVIGRNTYSIMMHHIMSFMLLKGFFYLLSRYTPLCEGFDSKMFFEEVNFVYLAGGAEASKWLYLFVGIGLPLFIAKGQKALVGGVKILLKDKLTGE